MRAILWAVRTLTPTLTMAGLVLAWELSCRAFRIPAYILPSPSAIILGGSAISPREWISHIVATMKIALAGYFIAIAISIPLAALLSHFATLSRAVYPILVLIHSAPIVAIAPIIVVTFGVGDVSRITITTLVAFFPLVIATTTGLLATPPELLELSRSLDARPIRQITQIRLPYAVPYIFSALKLSITLAVVGAVVAEFVSAEQGLGYTILVSTSMMKTPLAFASLVILVTLSLCLFQLVVFIQEYFFSWSVTTPSTTA